MQESFDRRALRVVEAAYRVADDTEGWIAGVLLAATPLVDRGAGLQAYTYEVPAPRTVVMRSRVVATASTPSQLAEVILETPLPPLLVPGFGVLLCAPADRVLPPFEARDLERWQMLRAHLLAGLRLQHAFARDTEPAAVIDPSGRVVPAEGLARGAEAREALRRRMSEVDRALGAAGRADPHRALREWKGLVDGRWSLVEVFDHDGRRFFVARRNDSPLRVRRPLSAKERQVLAFAALGYSNKQIPYTLGLAPSTISSHLRAGMQRIGSQDVAALADIFGVRGSYEASA